MSVRYKFKNDRDYQAIPCDGLNISVRDLKRAIIRAHHLGKVTDFDFLVTNTLTGETYTDETELINKNTTLTIQRSPLPDGTKKVWEEEVTLGPSLSSSSHVSGQSGALNVSSLLKIGTSDAHGSGENEDSRIEKMMANSAEMYQERNWTRYKGQKALPEGSRPPPNWQCVKCNQNHWLTECPFSGTEMKRTTGIPRTFLMPANNTIKGAKIDRQGMIVVNEMEKQAYSTNKVERNPWVEEEAPTQNKVQLPSELVCPICKDILKDAIMMPCCAGSACDDCAREAVVSSEKSKCPLCSDTANPEELIPYRMYRDKVDKFQNQTGYTKKTKVAAAKQAQAPAPSQMPKPTLPDIYLPDPNDVLFGALINPRGSGAGNITPPDPNAGDFGGSLTDPTPIGIPLAIPRPQDQLLSVAELFNSGGGTPAGDSWTGDATPSSPGDGLTQRSPSMSSANGGYSGHASSQRVDDASIDSHVNMLVDRDGASSPLLIISPKIVDVDLGSPIAVEESSSPQPDPSLVADGGSPLSAYHRPPSSGTPLSSRQDDFTSGHLSVTPTAERRDLTPLRDGSRGRSPVHRRDRTPLSREGTLSPRREGSYDRRRRRSRSISPGYGRSRSDLDRRGGRLRSPSPLGANHRGIGLRPASGLFPPGHGPTPSNVLPPATNPPVSSVPSSLALGGMPPTSVVASIAPSMDLTVPPPQVFPPASIGSHHAIPTGPTPLLPTAGAPLTSQPPPSASSALLSEFDPVAAFEQAMALKDQRKNQERLAAGGRSPPPLLRKRVSPPRAYRRDDRVRRTRSRSRGRYTGGPSASYNSNYRDKYPPPRSGEARSRTPDRYKIKRSPAYSPERRSYKSSGGAGRGPRTPPLGSPGHHSYQSGSGRVGSLERRLSPAGDGKWKDDARRDGASDRYDDLDDPQSRKPRYESEIRRETEEERLSRERYENSRGLRPGSTRGDDASHHSQRNGSPYYRSGNHGSGGSSNQHSSRDKQSDRYHRKGESTSSHSRSGYRRSQKEDRGASDRYGSDYRSSRYREKSSGASYRDSERPEDDRRDRGRNLLSRDDGRTPSLSLSPLQRNSYPEECENTVIYEDDIHGLPDSENDDLSSKHGKRSKKKKKKKSKDDDALAASDPDGKKKRKKSKKDRKKDEEEEQAAEKPQEGEQPAHAAPVQADAKGVATEAASLPSSAGPTIKGLVEYDSQEDAPVVEGDAVKTGEAIINPDKENTVQGTSTGDKDNLLKEQELVADPTAVNGDKWKKSFIEEVAPLAVSKANLPTLVFNQETTQLKAKVEDPIKGDPTKNASENKVAKQKSSKKHESAKKKKSDKTSTGGNPSAVVAPKTDSQDDMSAHKNGSKEKKGIEMTGDESERETRVFPEPDHVLVKEEMDPSFKKELDTLKADILSGDGKERKSESNLRVAEPDSTSQYTSQHPPSESWERETGIKLEKNVVHVQPQKILKRALDEVEEDNTSKHSSSESQDRKIKRMKSEESHNDSMEAEEQPPVDSEADEQEAKSEKKKKRKKKKKGAKSESEDNLEEMTDKAGDESEEDKPKKKKKKEGKKKKHKLDIDQKKLKKLLKKNNLTKLLEGATKKKKKKKKKKHQSDAEDNEEVEESRHESGGSEEREEVKKRSVGRSREQSLHKSRSPSRGSHSRAGHGKRSSVRRSRSRSRSNRSSLSRRRRRSRSGPRATPPPVKRSFSRSDSPSERKISIKDRLGVKPSRSGSGDESRHVKASAGNIQVRLDNRKEGGRLASSVQEKIQERRDRDRSRDRRRDRGGRSHERRRHR